MKRYETVDAYLAGQQQWKEALLFLRKIALSTKLTETLKWGVPVYTLQEKNIVGLAAFKGYVGLWFYQGALLKDKKKKLINAQEGKTRALLQWRFHALEDIISNELILREYIEEAILNQEQGKEIKPERKKPIKIPKELLDAFQSDVNLRESYSALSLSRQRAYAEYIDQAKKRETRNKRLDKSIPLILKGRGLHDRYR